MSNLSANSGNIKSVMRTALVGIKPADQVMLKGYLRVLLRLEADLEWVSANHPEVDLFMINNDFKQATNIIKLLEKNPSKPVLYIGRQLQGMDGTLERNLLTLPLKEMQVLNTWLFDYILVLQGRDNGKSRRRSSSEDIVNQTIANNPTKEDANTSETITHQKNLNRRNQPSPNSTNTVSDIKNTETTSSKTNESSSVVNNVDEEFDYLSPESKTNNQTILDIILTCREGISDKYQLSINGDVFAIVNPSKSLVWTKKNTLDIIANSSIREWRLDSTSTTPTSVGQNLKQWLWDITKDKIQELSELIDAKKTYQISYWVKPNATDNRSDLLRVMTAIEKVANTPAQISNISGVSIELVEKLLARLLVAGYLNKANYENLNMVEMGETKSSMTASEHNEVNSDKASKVDNSNANLQNEANENLSPLDAILSQRAAEQTSNIQTNSSTTPVGNEEVSVEPKNLETKPEKKGFLSRLRKKFGL